MPARPNLNQLKTPGITGVRMSLHTEFTSCHPTNSVKALKEEQGKYRQRWRKNRPTNLGICDLNRVAVDVGFMSVPGPRLQRNLRIVELGVADVSTVGRPVVCHVTAQYVLCIVQYNRGRRSWGLGDLDPWKYAEYILTPKCHVL